MAEGGDSIKYSDLVTPDDSIKNLITQLEAMNKSYESMVNAIRAGAEKTVKAIKDLSASTREGKEQLDDAAIYASRLEKAQKELKFAMSDTGKEVAWLKSQTASYNKMTVEQKQQAQALIGSYNKLKLELKEQVTLWKSLSEQERSNEAVGQQTLENILNLKGQLKSLDEQLKFHVEGLTRVQRAEQELEYLRSEEGKRLLTLKQQIAEEYAQRRREANAIDDVSRAEMKLGAVQDNNFYLLQKLNLQIKEETRMQKLRAQLNSSAEGSYNRLAAQYEINKIKLNAMSEAERKGTQAGRELEEETRNIYATMIKLQEATGNYKLSIGNYKTAWNGLGVAVNQVVRELPAAAVGINTFFLGISNNIPILVDEINKLRAANALAIKEGKPTTSVIKSIVTSLFSWQSALVVVLTVLSMHGKAIIDWATKLIKGADAVMTMNEQLENIAKELKNTNNSYGDLMTTYKKLQSEWSKLSSLKEQKQWIKDNATEFGRLDVSIRNVNEAEDFLINKTDNVIEAMRLRAKAAAAMKLAADKYEEALIKQSEAENKSLEGPSFSDYALAVGGAAIQAGPTGAISATTNAITRSNNAQNIAENIRKVRIENLKKESKAAEKDADAYFKLADAYNTQANSILGEYSRKHKTDKKRTPRERDLTDIIYRNDIELRKKYEASITALQNDEYAKRRKELMDAVMHENNQLKEKYRKNEAYLADYNNKYKELTDEQVKMIQEQQAMIKKTLINNGLKLSLQLEQIEKDRRINQLEINRNYDNLTIDETIASLEDERKLQIQYLSREFELTADTNRKLRKEGDNSARSEEDIRREFYNKQIAMIELYNQKILELKQGNIDLQLEIVKRGSQEELNLLLKKNELERQMALSQNRAKPASQRQNEESINKSFDKKGAQITGTFKVSGLNDAQAQAEAEFNIIKRSEYQITKFKLEQERERWVQQIALAKAGALDWSDAQIAAAEATVKGIDRQLGELDSLTGLIGEKGIGGALLTKLGFNDDQIKALEDATNIFLGQLQAIADAEVKLAEIQVEKAKERVEAAKSAYDAEVEARNNGYANNVATAKKELQQEKKNQADKEKLLAQAQRRQERINTIVQASSLITASANLWNSFSSIPIVGPALAIAAIATMWGSFAAAKIKASQLAKAQSEEYGEGGLEFLEGGSHASGNDIDLQTRNSKGKNMRAEGGEAMAIINKRSTRRYRKQLPDIVNALNKGTFNEKYINAFDKGDTLQAQIVMSNQVDLSKLERDIEAIRKQNSDRMLIGNDGTIIEIKGNVKRIYR